MYKDLKNIRYIDIMQVLFIEWELQLCDHQELSGKKNLTLCYQASNIFDTSKSFEVSTFELSLIRLSQAL